VPYQSGPGYSYEKWFRLHVVSGTYSTVSNIRWYWDGSFGAQSAFFRLAYRTASSYMRPVKTGPKPFPPTGFIDAAPIADGGDSITLVPGTWNVGSATGPGTQTYLVLAVAVLPGAPAGVSSPGRLVWLWDET
jgi:hypothetical protein